MGKQKVGIILRFGAFLPESFEYQFCMAGLLTYPGFMKPSHPECSGQWQVFHKTIIPRNTGSGFTAAGTVADSNRIPF